MINRFWPIQNLEGGPPNLDILGLKGEPNWILPLTEDGIDDYRDFLVTGKGSEDVNDLVETSNRLGLALPNGFVRFMHSEELRSWVITSDYILLGPGGLRKSLGSSATSRTASTGASTLIQTLPTALVTAY